MIRHMLAARALVAMIFAAVVGTWGVFVHPVDPADPFLGLIALQNPRAFRVLTYGYATLWFSSTFFAASLVLSVLAIVASRAPDRVRLRPLPRYPDPAVRLTPSLVLGEAHHARTVGPAPNPTWLTIPQRGLYTGVMILGAVGTGKTSVRRSVAAVEKSSNPERKVGGLVQNSEGTSVGTRNGCCRRGAASADYLKIGFNTAVC